MSNNHCDSYWPNQNLQILWWPLGHTVYCWNDSVLVCELDAKKWKKCGLQVRQNPVIHNSCPQVSGHEAVTVKTLLSSFKADRAVNIFWLHLFYRWDLRGIGFNLLLIRAADEPVMTRECTFFWDLASPPAPNPNQAVSKNTPHKKAQLFLWIGLIYGDVCFCVCLSCTVSGAESFYCCGHVPEHRGLNQCSCPCVGL